MKVLLSWIRDFVDVPGTAEEIGARMTLRGLPLEGIERLADPPPGAGSSRAGSGDDAVLDFEVTANRPDCLSIVGVAREMATVYGLPLKTPAAPPPGGTRVAPARAATTTPATIPITVEEPDLCRRYVGAIANVVIGPSPSWMQGRLHACGVRPINNVVDVTNYVQLELGQPMHAFDLARLAGPAIVVRRARPGEVLTTLDGKRRSLDPDVLVIADAERASAIGGVMGGTDSEVSPTTTQILFESAWFNPVSVRATSKRLALRTEASYRFERGGDLTGPAQAMARALVLLEVTGGGRARGPVIDVYPAPFEPSHLAVDRHQIERLLGMRVPDDEVERILTNLGFGVRALGGWQAAAPEAAAPLRQPPDRGWQVTPPGWRVDIARPVDLIEEVGRHHGFEHLPSTFPAVEQAPPPSDARIARDGRVRSGLLAMGFSEAITFAFIDDKAAAPYIDDAGPVKIANPLSEKFTTLRPSLIPGLVDVVSHNRRHGRRDVQVFEIGTRFSPRGESRSAAVAWTGLATPEHWSGGAREVDFFDVKGVADELCAMMAVTPTTSPRVVPFLVGGRSAGLAVGEAHVGVIGQLDPALAGERELPAVDPIYVLELDLDILTTLAPAATRFAQPLPRHPSVIRDLSILVDDSLSAESVRGTIRAAGPETLIAVREFDRYQGRGIPDGKVSLSLRLTFQASDRTLTDADVSAAMERIVGALTTDLGARQR